MPDQTKKDIAEVISKNHAIRFKNDNRKKFNEWLEKCPVMFASTPNDHEDTDIVSYKFNTISKRDL